MPVELILQIKAHLLLVPKDEGVFSHEWCTIVKYKPNHSLLFIFYFIIIIIIILYLSGGCLLHKDEASNVHN